MPKNDKAGSVDEELLRRTGPFTRRNLLRTMGVAGAAGLAGCGSGGDGGDGSDGGGDGSDGGGGGGDGGSDGGDGGGSVQTLRFSDQAAPSSLDPHAYNFSNTANLYAYPENGYEPLIYYPPTQEDISIVPVLATEVPTVDNGLVTNDGQTIDFPIREGVTFHTGGEMTAEDVRYSFDRVMTMGISAGASEFKGAVDSMEVVDDYTIRIHLKSPNTAVFLNSTMVAPYSTIVSKAAVEEHGGVQAGRPNQWVAQNSAGTGPYVLGEQRPTSVTWEPHEDYWGERGVDRVEQQIDPDLSARLAKLRAGDVHWAWAAPPNYQTVNQMQGVDIITAPQFNPGGFIFNADIPYDRDDVSQIAGDDTVPSDFFANKDVRKAFGFVFDWEGFKSGFMNGLAARTNQIHVKGMLGFDPSAPTLTQDLAKAEEHLKRAGYWEEGFTVTCVNESHPEFDGLNIRLKDYMEGLNDRITINSVSLPEGRAVVLHNQDPPGWPLEAHALLPIGADPTPYYQFFCSPEGSMGSRTGIPEALNPQIPELISESAVTADPNRRIEIFHQLQRLVYEDAPVAFAYAPEIINPIQSCVDAKWCNLWIRPHWKHWDISNC